MNAKDIQDHLKSGGVVQVSTYTRSTLFSKPEHAEYFRDNGNRLEARYGKKWLDIGYSSIKLGRIKEVTK